MQVKLRYKKKLLIYIKESIQNIEKFAFFFWFANLDTEYFSSVYTYRENFLFYESTI